VAYRRWLVELTVDGRVLRYSDVDVEVTTEDGATLIYSAGVDSALSVAEGEDVDLDIVDSSITWSDVAPWLDRSRLRILRWTEGTDYEAAVVKHDGRVVTVGYGAPEDPLQVGSSELLTADLPCPDPTAIVDSSTWPITTVPAHTLAEDQDGQYYPIIFGYPGYVQGSSVPRPVVPVTLAQFRAAAVATAYVVISDRPIAATQAHLANTTDGAAGWQTVSNVSDLLGRTVAVVDHVTTNATLPGAASDKKGFYAGFHTTYGGGNERGAYDVIVRLLRDFARDPVDWTRLANVRDLLNSYQVDTWINAPTTPWEWISGVLVPFLPVVVRRSARGLYLAPSRYYATIADAVGHLDADRLECTRRGLISSTSDARQNEITLEYRQLYSGSWMSRRVLTAQSQKLGDNVYGYVALTDPRVVGHPLCALSQSRYGLLRGTPVQVGWTWDDTTATLIHQQLAERLTLPIRTVQYHVPYDVRELEEGDVVTVTDSEVGLSSQVGIVSESPAIDEAGAVLTLRLPPTL